MKLKVAKNLKIDIFGNKISNFKKFNSSKSLKPNMYFSLKKLLRSRKIKSKRNVFKFKNVLPKFKMPKYSRKLSFNAKNNRNVFLRTKRKSSYGKSLLNKQKLKKFIPYTKEKNIKDLVLKYGDVFKQSEYVFQSTSLFNSENSLKREIVYKKHLYSNDAMRLYSYSNQSIEHNYNVAQLSYKKNPKPLARRRRNRVLIFNRVLPNNLILDLRLNKVIQISPSFKNNAHSYFPFVFSNKKLIQHFRLKRS